MTNITTEQIKTGLHDTDIEVLIDLMSHVSDQIISTDLDELLHDFSPSEILRAIENGVCSSDDDYFTIDSLGHLISFTEKELKNFIISNYGDEIAEFILKYYRIF